MKCAVAPRSRFGRLKLYLATIVLSVPLAFAVRFGLQHLMKGNLAAGAASYIAEKDFRPLSEPLQKLLDDAAHVCPPTKRHRLLEEPAIDFTLPDDQGRHVNLTELADGRPLAIVFYNGFHCVHCVAQLYSLNDDFKLFEELGVRIVAISPDPPAKTAAQLRKYGRFQFPVLADVDNRVAQAYGVFEPANEKESDLLFHGTFLVDSHSRVYWLDVADEPFLDNKSLLILLANRIGTSRPRP